MIKLNISEYNNCLILQNLPISKKGLLLISIISNLLSIPPDKNFPYELGIYIQDVILELYKLSYSFIFSPFDTLNILIKLVDNETNKCFSSLEKHNEVISPFLLFSFAEKVKNKFKYILLSFLWLFIEMIEILQFENPKAI